jgi:hypothetical protein
MEFRMSDPLAFASVTPRLGLPLLFAAQAHKELFHNEALARIDALMHPSVEAERDVPPDTPDESSCWLVGPAPTDAWADAAGALAILQGGGWQFAKPVPGMRVLNLETGQFLHYSHGWKKAESIEEPSGGLYVDSHARAAIGALISALRAAGIYASV